MYDVRANGNEVANAKCVVNADFGQQMVRQGA